MPVAVSPLDALAPAARFVALAGIDRIFFEASSVQSFDDAAARFAFHWRWLGRYLVEEPEHAFIARDDAGVAGYLVGSLEDPARRAAFADLDYFATFAPETARYPAHLHVNVAAERRGSGVGERLVSAFTDHARAAGASGVHVVTGAGMRNVRFYERLGFRQVMATERGSGRVIMLAKAL